MVAQPVGALGRSRAARIALPIAFIPIWSSGYLVGAIGARHSGSPLALVCWRFVLALVVVGGVAVLTGARWPRQPRIWAHLLVIGALLQTVQLGGVYLGLGKGVPAGLAALVLSAAPLVVAAVAVPMFGERLTGWQWVGLVLGVVGVGLSLRGNLSGGGDQRLVGYAFTGLALVGFAAGTLYQKRFGAELDLRAATAIQLLGATATSFPLALLHGGLRMSLTGTVLFALVWLALVNSVGAFVLLMLLLRTRTGGAATSLLYLVPPVTALIGVPLLGQRVTAGIFAGMAVSAAGVLLVLFARDRTRGGGRVVAAATVGRTGNLLAGVRTGRCC